MNPLYIGFAISILVAASCALLCYKLMKQNAYLKETRWPRAGVPTRNPNRFDIVKPVEKIIK